MKLQCIKTVMIVNKILQQITWYYFYATDGATQLIPIPHSNLLGMSRLDG